ncbi:Na/Pi cotransporter family protein [Flavilitoribacter nigricans]|uniref:Na/Pi cotransporter n=1 Tax=Flavilitoribacter nigricans (strain ATCC 23147 / DSM 23189 / NBRC 102662 / NCIMB 1420 / SS-2) TaxID=1122177 RepID=A0A2D0NE30_FLAN2|nr:Na/Pi cotransporter family protein [Flavilitoribacter nigricans]PHN06630.1 Na/Pi cotransporter [Flavilitoribacter nigricans DSM 23189 = NBRC 102662]
METGTVSIFNILGSLALFIYGMKVMSEGIQKAAGSQMRVIMRRMTSNRFIGLLSGFLITGIIQSSSATTVMTVSFVNAGLISLSESAGIMMGANIGTTITGWLIALDVSKFNFADYSLLLIAIGLPLFFVKKYRWGYWGEFLIGFALLFLGLNFLSVSFPDFSDYPDALEFLANYASYGYLSTILFLFVGAIIAGLIQSSSAAMALTIVMLAKGWITLDVAAAMILGENLGTTVTAEIASLVGNVHAKRSARIHSLFNLFGITWMVFLLPYFVDFLENVVTNYFVTILPQSTADVITLAAFHTTFNLSNALLLIGFVPWLIKLSIKTVPSKGVHDENFRLAYINSLLKTPELSIIEAQKELARYSVITSRMSIFTRELLFSTEAEEQEELLDRIAKYEEINDRVELELGNYVQRLSSEEISTRTSVQIRSIIGICSDLEQIGDNFYQMSRTIKRKIEEKIWFNQQQRERLKEMFQLVDNAFDVLNKNIAVPEFSQIDLEPAIATEKKINALRDLMRRENQESQEDPNYNMNSSLIYNNLFTSLEQTGDHIMNISEAIKAYS